MESLLQHGSHSQNLVSCNDIEYVYSKSGEGVKQFDCQLESGHVYGLLGKNGAGKTTLIKIMSSLLFSKRGLCSILGHDSTKRSVEMMRELYVIPEEIYVPPLKGHTYIKYYSVFYPKFDTILMDNLCKEMSVPLNLLLTSLSQGQRKKFLIAFALATHVKVIIMDEPTNGLDIPSKTLFKRLVYNYAVQDQLVFISTHQLKDIEQVVDTYVFMDKGSCMFTISVEDISTYFLISLSDAPTVESDDVLYSIKTLGGYAVLQRNTTQVRQEIDLELFFTVAWENPKIITDVLEKFVYEKT